MVEELSISSPSLSFHWHVHTCVHVNVTRTRTAADEQLVNESCHLWMVYIAYIHLNSRRAKREGVAADEWVAREEERERRRWKKETWPIHTGHGSLVRVHLTRDEARAMGHTAWLLMGEWQARRRKARRVERTFLITSYDFLIYMLFVIPACSEENSLQSRELTGQVWNWCVAILCTQ